MAVPRPLYMVALGAEGRISNYSSMIFFAELMYSMAIVFWREWGLVSVSDLAMSRVIIHGIVISLRQQLGLVFETISTK